MPCATLADLILILHVLFVGIVVLGVPLIIIGALCHWQWVRNPIFRFTHLAMIAFVAMESLTGIACPLTTWESQLRILAGQQGDDSQGFIAQWLDHLLFYHLPSQVFTAIYVAFALLVASLFYVVPLKLKTSAPAPNDPS